MDHRDEKLEATGGCRMCLAIPGKIIEITSDATHSALVDVMGVRRKVDLGLLQEDKPKTGNWVLIHVGFAMSKISEEGKPRRQKAGRLVSWWCLSFGSKPHPRKSARTESAYRGTTWQCSSGNLDATRRKNETA